VEIEHLMEVLRMNEIWKGIKQEFNTPVFVEEVKIDTKQKQQEERLKEVLSSIQDYPSQQCLIQTRHQNIEKTKKDTTKMKDYLEQFKTNSEFVAFLNKCSSNDQEIKSFKKEYLQLLRTKPSYGKILRWNNYTIYKKPIAITSAIVKYFSDVPKTYNKTTIIKGIVGKAMKSKRRKAEDKGTNDEYIHKIKRKVGYVDMFISSHAKMFRKDVMTKIEPSNVEQMTAVVKGVKLSKVPSDYMDLGGRKVEQQKAKFFNSTAERVGKKQLVAQYDVLHPYAYKFMNKRYSVEEAINKALETGREVGLLLSATDGKREAKATISKKANILQKLKTKFGIDWIKIQDYLRTKHGFTDWDNRDLVADRKQTNRDMRIAFHMLTHQKRFRNFEETINTNKEIAFKMGQQFVSSFRENSKWKM
jgi:hypothetical protein